MTQANGQSHKHSLYESLINVSIGYVIAIGSQMVILPLYDIHIPTEQNFTMALMFTLISLVRSYILRRWFNKLSFQK